MKKSSLTFTRPAAHRFKTGSALIIVLSFVVLLTVVVLAMLSHSIFNGLISNASSNAGKSDLYAHGAINQIVGDLRQEIVAGSTSTVVDATDPVNGTIYRPSTVAASVPANAGPGAYGDPAVQTSVWSNPNGGLLNLVKQSASGVAFQPYDTSVPARAAAAPSTTPSRNGRYISLARWNKPLLLPKATATITSSSAAGTTITDSGDGSNVTPTSTFVAPDWILTAADGSNPTTLDSSSSLTASNLLPKSSKFIVGRYAYTIYNEGGLLDANVAGYPPNTPTAAQKIILSQKGSTGFADLTQVPGIADLKTLGSTLPNLVANSIVGWRNAATTQATLSPAFPRYAFSSTVGYPNYLNYILGQTGNFMSVGYTSSASDRSFASRQELINFSQSILPLNNSTAATRSQAKSYLQDALMYLGTFSRTLNQPSYWPDPGRPKVVGPAADGNRDASLTFFLVAGGARYNGGNSAFGLDNTYNPAFKSIRVGTAFTRNDGSTAIVGEPLVKKRFALNRLAWLTCDGPIAKDDGTLNTSDSNINAIINYLAPTTAGATVLIPRSFLQRGGPANIKKYFGLTWVPSAAGSTSPGGYWSYDHGIQISGQTVLGSLGQVAALPAATAREPDFFELLLAGIHVGGIAKGSGHIGATSLSMIRDSTIIAQIMQIGANIIDEANPTQYPTHIVYPFGSSVLRSVYGAMDLPYLDSINNVRYIVKPANPAATTNTPVASATPITSSFNSSTGLYSDPEGTGVFMYVPIIWNPYDVSGPTVPTGLAPGTGGNRLRIVISSALPALDANLSATSSANWPGPSSTDWSSATGLGSSPAKFIPTSNWTTLVANAPAVSTSYSSTATDGTVTTTTSYAQSVSGTFAAKWTSEDSTALTFSNDSALYREPTALMKKGYTVNSVASNLDMGATHAILTQNATWTAGVPEMSGASPTSGLSFLGFLGTTFPLRWTLPANSPGTGYFIYTVNNLPQPGSSTPGISTNNSPGCTVRLEYQVGSLWIPYMEYPTNLQYNHDFVPITEGGTSASPFLLSPNTGNSFFTAAGSLWDINRNGSPGGFGPGCMTTWDARTATWGLPVDVWAPFFLDASTSATAPATTTYQLQTRMPSRTVPVAAGSRAQSTHSAGGNMVQYGWFEPSGGVYMGPKQQNLFSSSTTNPTSDYYADADGTVRRAMAAYVGGSSPVAGNVNGSTTWSWSANTSLGLPLASTVGFTITTFGGPQTMESYTPATNQSQSRPIILHRPYRSVAELGYVFSNIPFKNIDFFTPESPYSALLDVFCMNEDYRTDAVMAGRVDLNTKQAPVLQALLAGTYRDENPTKATPAYTQEPALTATEAIGISQALVKRTTVGGTRTDVTVSTTGAQPLFNIADLVGRWISGGTVGTTAAPINGAAQYDGFSADLSSLYLGSTSTASQASPAASGNYNILSRFRESTMRALSDAGQAGTWNLLIDLVAQTGRFPTNATGVSDFVVDGERRYWVHVAIDRSTGQIIDQNIETVNE